VAERDASPEPRWHGWASGGWHRRDLPTAEEQAEPGAPAQPQPGSGWARAHPFELGLAVIAVVALALRLAYVDLVSRHIHFGLDTVWYQLESGTISSGHGFIDPTKYFGTGISVPTAFRPPLYPTFLAMVTKSIGSSRHTFQMVGCVVGLATVVLIGLLGRRLAGNAAGLCAAGIAAAYPILIVADGSVMSENLVLPLVAGLLLAVYWAIDHPTIPRWMVVGLLGGACILTRGDAIVLVGLVAVLTPLLVKRATWARRAALAGVTVLAVTVVVMPWLVRNQARLGTFELATLDTSVTLAGANCARTYSSPALGSWDFECTQTPHADHLDEMTLSRRLRTRGLDYARDHADRLPVVATVRVLRVWGLYAPSAQARSESPESRFYAGQIISWLVYLPTAALAVVGLVVLRRRGVAILPLLIVIAAVTVTAALAYGKQRLRIVAEPVLIVTAAAALVHLAGRLRGSQRSPDASRPVDR
jgi:4-amino-4-deoxy-L-arabinose transferase-like glycosyltransferase